MTVWDDVRMVTDVEVFRPGFGRVLVVVVVLLCAGGAVTGLLDDATTVWPYLPLLALLSVLAWAAYWRPAVVVSPAGVELRNVTRTVEIPWTALNAVETHYALTLHTAYGSYASWAAPAPSQSRVRRADRTDVTDLPESTYGSGGSVRPGDLAGTDSGQAAALVRSRWEQLRDTGVLNAPRLEREQPVVHWHVGTLAVVVALGALSVLTLAL